MDKKKLFQIQNLKAKQNSYESTLNELLQQQQQLILNNLNNSDTLDTTITNIGDIVNELNASKTLIEIQIADIKKILSRHKYDIVNATNKIKQLPETLKINIKNEVNIYNEELANLDNLILEAELININKIADANTNKADLLTNIISLNNQIDEQNNIISDLQFNAHNSRKNTLQDLHYKKQQKVQMQEQIDNINANSKIYNEHINKLTNNNTILEQLKINIINNYYTNTNITETNNTPESILDIIKTLNDYDIEINLDNINITNPEFITKPEFINELVNKIDNTIKNNTARMISITNKSERAQNKNNVQIENIKSNFNNLSRNKVVSFKDSYKIEKQKRTELQSKCDELLNLYNNFTELVIDKINEKYKACIEDLNTHKQYAVERLNIMKTRFNNEFEQNKIILETQINQVQTELTNNNKQFNDLNNQLRDIQNKLANLDKSNIEIHNLDTKINQITTTIDKIKNDIAYIENN